MSLIKIKKKHLINLANAIREKTGETGNYTIPQMISKIEEITNSSITYNTPSIVSTDDTNVLISKSYLDQIGNIMRSNLGENAYTIENMISYIMNQQSGSGGGDDEDIDSDLASLITKYQNGLLWSTGTIEEIKYVLDYYYENGNISLPNGNSLLEHFFTVGDMRESNIVGLTGNAFFNEISPIKYKNVKYNYINLDGTIVNTNVPFIKGKTFNFTLTPYTLGNKVTNIRILDICKDNIVDGSGKAALTLRFEDSILKIAVSFLTESSANKTYSKTLLQWHVNPIRNFINEFYKNRFNPDIADLIKPVYKNNYMYGYSETSCEKLPTTADYVWLPSDKEIFNNKTEDGQLSSILADKTIFGDDEDGFVYAFLTKH